MSRPVEFLKASGKWGISLMTGGVLSFSIAVYEHFWGSSLSALVFVGISVVAIMLGSYLAWDEERKKVDAAEKRIRDREKPQLTFVGWGPPKNGGFPATMQRGFYLMNHGTTALEITVSSFVVGKKSAYGDTIAEIASGKEGFSLIRLEQTGPFAKYDLDRALQVAWADKLNTSELTYSQPLRVSVSVIYRNFEDFWYQSACDLTYCNGKITFSGVRQTFLGTNRPASI